ncbi:hypothetical protein BH20ACT6_BH20ACT6_22090 [soil metagenome]
MDKLTLAALEASLRGPLTPVAEMLAVPVEDLRRRAETVADQLADRGVDAAVVSSTATVGGGGAPGVELPSAAVRLPMAYAAALRAARTPVVGRVDDGRTLLDLRTVAPQDDAVLVDAVAEVVEVAGR